MTGKSGCLLCGPVVPSLLGWPSLNAGVLIHLLSTTIMITASDALKRLKEGSQRFVSGVLSIETIIKQNQRADFVQGEAPFAIILGCPDSRVAAEIIFDQGFGDLRAGQTAVNKHAFCV